MASLSHSGISPAISSSSPPPVRLRSEEHTSELQSQSNLVCRLLLEKKKNLPILVRPPPRVEGNAAPDVVVNGDLPRGRRHTPRPRSVRPRARRRPADGGVPAATPGS